MHWFFVQYLVHGLEGKFEGASATITKNGNKYEDGDECIDASCLFLYSWGQQNISLFSRVVEHNFLIKSAQNSSSVPKELIMGHNVPDIDFEMFRSERDCSYVLIPLVEITPWNIELI